MKKLLLRLICGALLSGVAMAANTITASPSNFNISSSTGFFDVTFTLQTPVTNITSFDLFLQSSSSGVDNGNFTVSITTSAVSDATPAEVPQNPDLISTSSIYASGSTARNNHDQGFTYSTDQTISGNTFTLETLRITYNFSSLPTVGTTFTFSTTPSDAAGPGGGPPGTYFYSDDFSNLNTIDTAASFTVTVVPEPSTCLAGVAAFVVIGSTTLRRRAAG